MVRIIHQHKGFYSIKLFKSIIKLRNQGNPYSEGNRTYTDEFILQRYAEFLKTNQEKFQRLVSLRYGSVDMWDANELDSEKYQTT